MDVVMLWFRCKNKDCGLVGERDKIAYRQHKIRQVKDIETSQRRFMRHVQGSRIYKGDDTYFRCKYGDICLWSHDDNANSYIYTLDNVEECSTCIKKHNNEKMLFQ